MSLETVKNTISKEKVKYPVLGALLGMSITAVAGLSITSVVVIAATGSIIGLIASPRVNNEVVDSKKLFSLLLIIDSDKLKGKVENKTIKLDILKTMINDSSYFLVENEDENTLEEARTSTELPDLDKDNNFILKITGQCIPDINKYPTKSWLRDNITSETCQIEKVLHLLDASIAEKFVRTV